LFRNASGWQITKPLHALADAQKVEAFLKTLLGQRILESSEMIPAIWGLRDRRGQGRSLSTRGASVTRLFGLALKIRRSLRSVHARDSVYRLPPETAKLLRITPEDLRDRRLLPLNLDMVDAIRIRTPEKEFSLRRHGEAWVVKDGESERPASGAAVQALADAVSTAEVSAYDAVSDDKGTAFGLSQPRCKVAFVSVLSENTPEARAGEQVLGSLTIGKSENGRVFVQIGETPEVLSVPETIMNAVPLDPSAWISPG
jgi:hypothetical protein